MRSFSPPPSLRALTDLRFLTPTDSPQVDRSSLFWSGHFLALGQGPAESPISTSSPPAGTMTFAYKLYELTHAGDLFLPATATHSLSESLLEDTDREARANFIWWAADGSFFCITQQERFAQIVLPKYFKHNVYGSFLRQMNLYGFKRFKCRDLGLTLDETEGFRHESFLRERSDLLHLVRRRVGADGKEEDSPRSHLRDEDDALEALKAELDEIHHRGDESWKDLRSDSGASTTNSQFSETKGRLGVLVGRCETLGARVTDLQQLASSLEHRMADMARQDAESRQMLCAHEESIRVLLGCLTQFGFPVPHGNAGFQPTTAPDSDENQDSMIDPTPPLKAEEAVALRWPNTSQSTIDMRTDL
eukprot:m.476579 g.476579  ORF g.476579 m.476579 type:complete len:362 (-) comp57153_c0_seq23:236-1321(-)